MSSTILVTGGTGTLGRHVVPLLRDTGAALRVLSRKAHDAEDGVDYVQGDLLADEGVEPAVSGAGVVVHLAGGPKGDERATANLVRAASRAGVRHFVLISVTAADAVPIGYYRAKVGAERVVAESDLPWTTLRAAQFHDLVLFVASKLVKLPVMPSLSGMRLQPVDSREVAQRLVQLALGEPAGRVPDLSGPKVYPFGELMRSYLRARGKHRLLVPVRIPGRAGKVYRAGRNLNRDSTWTGRCTWEEFLAERFGPAGG